MNSFITKSLIALAALTAVPMAAEAGHKSYCWGGHRYGCNGEAHMINALNYMEREYYDRHTDRYLFAAQSQLRQAYREVRSSRARWYLREALDHLNHYQYSHCRSELDRSASLVINALRAEQNYHRSNRRPPHYGGGHYNRPGHGHGRPVIRIGNGNIGIVIGG